MENQVVSMLRARVANSTQVEVAKELRISQQYLSDVLLGRRTPGAKILKALRLRKVVSYESLTAR